MWPALTATGTPSHQLQSSGRCAARVAVTPHIVLCFQVGSPLIHFGEGVVLAFYKGDLYVPQAGPGASGASWSHVHIISWYLSRHQALGEGAS